MAPRPRKSEEEKLEVRSIHLGSSMAAKQEKARDIMKAAEALRVRTLGNQQTTPLRNPMPQQRNLGPTDSGEAQRVGGLKQAGEKFTGGMGASNIRQAQAKIASQKSTGSSKSSKR
jgi:hypothetical protein